MTAITPETIRTAKAHLRRYGLRTDGTYGERRRSCCTVGHIAVALGELVDRISLVDVNIHHVVDDAFREWNPSAAAFSVTGWNDGLSWRDGLSERDAVDAVAAFYDWLEQRAEAEGALT